MSGVTVICPNNRRVNVRFDGAAKTLCQILDEACKKQGYMSEKYGLKHHNRFVDLSLTFRMSGLPQNCTLEMAELPLELQQKQVKEENEDVQVALQMPDGRRIMGSVPSDATLLDVLLDFERRNNMKLVEPESEVENTQPVCYYLQNEFVGPLTLAATTLKQLGVRGRALFRYAARQVDPTKLQEINEAVTRSQAKLRKLEATYEKKLQDNLEYEREQERRRQEEEAIEQLRQQQIDLQAQTSASESMIAEATGESATPTDSSCTQPKPVSDEIRGTSASPRSSVVSSRQARLDALQTMLSMVDRSIVDGSDLPWQTESYRHPVPMDFQEFKFPEETKGMDLTQRSRVDGDASSIVSAVVEPCDRRALAFSLADVEEVTSEEMPPEFYDITVDDVHALLRDIKEQSEERPFISDAYVKQKNFERKLQAWKFTVIRVRMPDRSVLQGVFRTLENVTALYRFVEENLRERAVRFDLCLPPNIVIEKKDQSLLQASLAPRATLLYKQKSGNATLGGYIKPSLMELAKSPAEADRIAAESLAENSTYVPYRPPMNDGEQRVGPQRAAGGGASKTETPKWLQKGKK